MTYLKVNVDTPIQLISAGEFVSEVPWKHMSRSIENFELILGVQETVYIREEQEDFEIGEGDILLLYPGRTHRGYRESLPGVKFYWFHFDVPATPNVLSSEEMKQETSPMDGLLQRHGVMRDIYLPQSVQADNGDRIHIIVNQILHVANSHYLTYHSANYLFTSLLIEISELALSRLISNPVHSQGNVSMNKIIEWTRIHAEEPLTVTDLARKFNYNKDYISRLFKQNTGMRPLEFIHSIRINKAKELISRTDMSIKQVAEEAGYTDEKYFMRLFKKRVHMTPSQYRNAYHKTFMNNV
ncbi:AraC family transcriptional regulator [Paenibacillus jamilae]|uniref:AraC family transcriptional regulator n=1 Tax=Paenibacillus TaxID=44249 RepID=UPI000E3BF572|nr:AraC family transcriptional regulator [Paenibacillus jamilae]RFT93240.1 AraC family transcriptional regulator [Paenibacillus jamilae]